MNKVRAEWEVIAVGDISLRWAHDLEGEKSLLKHESQCNEAWQRKLNESQGRLFNGSVLNWTGMKKNNDAFDVLGHFIEYKYFCASKTLPQLQTLVCPVAVSGITLLCDGAGPSALFARRSRNVTSYPGYWELVPSGTIDRKFALNDGHVDFRSQLRLELNEEANVPSVSIKNVKPFALVFDHVDRVYDVCCLIELNMSRKALMEGLADSDEYGDSELLEMGKVDDFVQNHRNEMIPTSVALIEAYHRAFPNGIKN